MRLTKTLPKYYNSKYLLCFLAVSEASRAAINSDGGLAAGLWRPYPSRLPGLPGFPGSSLQERSMYSLYGSLLGLSGLTAASLPGLGLHSGLTSSSMTPTTSSLSAHMLPGMLLSVQAQHAAAAAAAQQEARTRTEASGSPLRSPPAATTAAIYGQRYHPYHLPSPTPLKPGPDGPLSIP